MGTQGSPWVLLFHSANRKEFSGIRRSFQESALHDGIVKPMHRERPSRVRLSRREVLPEIMDQPGLDPLEHACALRGLERINRMSGMTRRLWRRIRIVARNASAPVRVLDVACGGGDVAARLARRAALEHVPVTFAGCDISETAVAHARANADSARLDIAFFQHDILAEPLPEPYDIVMCNLFLHHMDEKSAVLLLERLRDAAARLVLVHDLERSALGYAVAYAGTRLLSRSPIVHHDGPLSVRAAFTRAEVRAFAAQCGMSDARVSWQWPFRFILEWHRA